MDYDIKKKTCKERIDVKDDFIWLQVLRCLSWFVFVISSRVIGAEPTALAGKHPLQFLLHFSWLLEKMSTIYVTQFTAWPLVPCVDFLDHLIGNRGICRHFEIHDTGRFSSFSSAIIQKGVLKTEQEQVLLWWHRISRAKRGCSGECVALLPWTAKSPSSTCVCT